MSRLGVTEVYGLMQRIENYAAKGVPPLWGWHDDHRGKDRTPEYLPALQQVRAEFLGLLLACDHHGLLGGRALQLGLGRGGASHVALREAFRFVCSIDADHNCVDALVHDWGVGPDRDAVYHGATGDPGIRWSTRRHAPYDLLFIDANHSEAGVRRDFEDYVPLVRAGGIVAFHDALKRPGYEDEITVWKFLAGLPVTTIGTEVGIAYLVKP